MRSWFAVIVLTLASSVQASYEFANGRFTGDLGAGNEVNYPVMVAGWVKYTDHPVASRYVINFGANSASLGDSVAFRTFTTDGQFRGTEFDSGLGASHATFTLADPTSLDNTWFPFIAVFRSSTDRQIYVGERANTATDSNSRTSSGARHISIGKSLGDAADFAGNIAEIAIGSINPSNAEIDAFMGGEAANSVWSNLAGYWSLSTDDDTPDDESGNGGPTLSLNGTMDFDADHPTITQGGSIAPLAAKYYQDLNQ